MYQPFDFPGMPYEEDGVLYLEVGQGRTVIITVEAAPCTGRVTWAGHGHS